MIPEHAIMYFCCWEKMPHNVNISFTTLTETEKKTSEKSIASFDILPHFLFIDSIRHSEENTLTQVGLYLAHSEPSQVSTKYGVKTS